MSLGNTRLWIRNKDHWWKNSPKPRSSRRDFEWETSGGKSSRGYQENLDVPEDPKPKPYRAVESDVDDFLREQREKVAKAMANSE